MAWSVNAAVDYGQKGQSGRSKFGGLGGHHSAGALFGRSRGTFPGFRSGYQGAPQPVQARRVPESVAVSQHGISQGVKALR